ncbi:glycosyltransferase family protein [Pontibacter roseus]|uniref:hypothetical protein n=1 Tax=Pontibacter roseus TaxID=336989 RepID=UPI0003613F03|nr:hypothetical protein [Pontibacter roseus]
MSEKRILLASLLKPISDTRMYEKLGLSLSKIPGATVHICGFRATVPAGAPPNIVFHSIFNFKRLSLGRAKAQLQFYRLLLQVKPQLLLVTTHELLLVSLLYKNRYGCRLIYDVQENYSLNLRAQHNYNWPLKQLLALGVRSMEHLTATGTDHFLLAERSYAQELPFLKGRYTLLENKFKAPSAHAPAITPVAIPSQGPLRLLYSGTIAEEYGVFEAIELAEKLYLIRPETTLTIIGYCANTATWESILQRSSGKSYIKLIGGNQLVPHQQILEQITQSHVGLLPYRPNESTFRCIPTKLFEYMAHALSILIQQNPLWETLVDETGAGMSIDFSQPDLEALYSQMLQQPFYATGIPADIYWETEEKKLLQVVQPLLA